MLKYATMQVLPDSNQLVPPLPPFIPDLCRANELPDRVDANGFCASRQGSLARIAGLIMSFRVLIADDEELARERLRDLLKAESGIEIVGECGTGRETVQSIRKESPDLVFLDVQMPELDGFEVLNALGAELPIIIFVTAHERHAVRAFEAHAADFLLKPFDRKRFQLALSRGQEKARDDQRRLTSQQLSEIVDICNAPAARPVERLSVKSVGKITLVKIEDIDWIQGANNYAELHVGNATHLLRQTLGSLQEQLAGSQIVRISRSTMVNLDRVVELAPKSHGDYYVALRNGTRLTVSRSHRKDLERLLGSVSR